MRLAGISALAVGTGTVLALAVSTDASARARPVRVSVAPIERRTLADSGYVRATLRSPVAVRVRVGLRLEEADGRLVSASRTVRWRLRAHRTRRVVLVAGPSLRQAADACAGRRLTVVAAPPRRVRVRMGSAHTPLALVPPACGHFFADDSFWNRPLAATAPLDPNSPALVAELQRQIGDRARVGLLPTISDDAYGVPLYTVGAGDALVPVKLDQPPALAPDLTAAFAAVPLPEGAQPASGSDGSLTVWQPATDTLWEFWQLRRASDGWHARWGGRIEHASSDAGHYSAPHATWGATATGLPLVGGLVTQSELRRGRIDHALAFAVPAARADAFARPAQRTDGSTPGAGAIPEGAHFRLDPTLDVAALGLPRVTRMLAEAAQRYGIVLRDQAGVVAFYAQTPGSAGGGSPSDPFGGARPQDLLRSFPWDRLQVLPLDLRAAPQSSCVLLILCG
jgi:hypothetical protein